MRNNLGEDMEYIGEEIGMMLYSGIKGEIRPLQFVWQEKKVFVRKILNAEYYKFSIVIKVTFECEVEVEGEVKKCILKYYENLKVWELHRF